jgi:hypothetical protein
MHERKFVHIQPSESKGAMAGHGGHNCNLAFWEAEIRRITFQGQSRKKYLNKPAGLGGVYL